MLTCFRAILQSWIWLRLETLIVTMEPLTKRISFLTHCLKKSPNPRTDHCQEPRPSRPRPLQHWLIHLWRHQKSCSENTVWISAHYLWLLPHPPTRFNPDRLILWWTTTFLTIWALWKIFQKPLQFKGQAWPRQWLLQGPKKCLKIGRLLIEY